MLIRITWEDTVKIAIPMFDSRVSPRFDFASKVLIATIEGGRVVDRKEYSLNNLNPIRRSALLKEQEVNVLICGGISNFSMRLLMGNGIEVIPMVPGEVEEILTLFISGNLNSAIIPMITGKRYGHHGGRGRCQGRKVR